MNFLWDSLEGDPWHGGTVARWHGHSPWFGSSSWRRKRHLGRDLKQPWRPGRNVELNRHEQANKEVFIPILYIDL